VVYYSLAIGHHVGVMDCFQSMMEVPLEDYRQWVSQLPEGPARRKMEGVLKWGEVEVNHTHAGEILPLLNAAWTKPLAACLQAMLKEPALYLMIRKYA
jgi:hydrogenase-4 component J